MKTNMTNDRKIAFESTTEPAPVVAVGSVGTVIGRYRWVICALLFFATTINYVDRQVLGFLAPDLQRAIGWNEAQYGWIVVSFQAAYAISLLVVGRVMDK